MGLEQFLKRFGFRVFAGRKHGKRLGQRQIGQADHQIAAGKPGIDHLLAQLDGLFQHFRPLRRRHQVGGKLLEDELHRGWHVDLADVQVQNGNRLRVKKGREVVEAVLGAPLLAGGHGGDQGQSQDKELAKNVGHCEVSRWSRPPGGTCGGVGRWVLAGSGPARQAGPTLSAPRS
jgi:hypothetical protein